MSDSAKKEIVASLFEIRKILIHHSSDLGEARVVVDNSHSAKGFNDITLGARERVRRCLTVVETAITKLEDW